MAHSLSDSTGKYFFRDDGGAAAPASGWSELVAPVGGDEATIQAAINADYPDFHVEGGNTYTENLTFDEPCQKMIVHPGATISGTIDVDSDGVTMEFMQGCTITGQINWDGADGRIICHNGVTFNAQIILSTTLADSFSFNGGGFATLCEDRIDVGDGNSIVQNISCDTKTGGTGRDAFIYRDNSENAILSLINIINSDNQGVLSSNSSTDKILTNLIGQASDSWAIEANGARSIYAACNVVQASNAIRSDGAGDDSVISGNISDGPVINSTGDDNQLIYGTRIDTTLTTLATTGGTYAGNDTTAF